MKADWLLYFAYGADMDLRHLQALCPGAALTGRGLLRGFRFVITEKGRASLVPDPNGTVFGVLWQIPPAEVGALQEAFRSEGSGEELTASVRNAAGQTVSARAFIASGTGEGKATAEYLNLILMAGRAFHFPEAYCQQLEQFLPA